ncbi:hypothetical protein JMJ35_007430 [Cladonia borealis]|uniref:Heterokaryon incompatibility domain-containing protein n=1 Tax=Cladonia borealis TaxID=184061 RepID=A0AA39QY99_9LECA|nr:hypothetical protein JMJ35_007430 [Cladonia borealis]
MQSQQEGFKYDPLPDTRSFRLIKEIASDATGSHLSCVLETFSLDACPSYRCLSYTWGPALISDAESGETTDTARFELIVRAEGTAGVLLIHENLSDFLCELSDSSSSGSKQYMWVDAICIDQDNLKDRSSQVSMMDSIYSGADKVIVWLGKDMADFSDFAWFHSDALASEYLQGSQTDSTLKRTNVAAPIFQGAYRTEPGILEKWQSYCRFFEQRRWFNRAWVVQEVVLARPSDIEVWCGNERLRWTNMVAFALGLFLSGLGMDIRTMRNRVKGQFNGAEVVRLGALQEFCERGGPDQESSCGDVVNLKELLQETYDVTDSEGRRHAFLQHVLAILRPFDSFDPRDKVYAAMGIVGRFLPSGSRPFIYPEYERPVKEVYEHTAKFLLEHLPYLSVLALVEDPSRRETVNLPSWVPDFCSQQANMSFRGATQMRYNASAGQPPGPFWSLKDSILSLRGGCHDTVAQLGISLTRPAEESWLSESGALLEFLEVIDDVLRLCSTLDPTYINGTSRVQALWRTWIADQESLPADFLHQFRCLLLYHLGQASGSQVQRVTDLLESIVYQMTVLNGSARSEEDFLLTPQQVALYAIQNCAKPEERTVELDAMLEEVSECSQHFRFLIGRAQPFRRLYTTSKGYIGLGPMSTQVGDEVWIICDAKTPFVLRPQPENTNAPKSPTPTEEVKQFRLVGETYLHGFMNGEALQSGLLDHLRWIDLI